MYMVRLSTAAPSGQRENPRAFRQRIAVVLELHVDAGVGDLVADFDIDAVIVDVQRLRVGGDAAGGAADDHWADAIGRARRLRAGNFLRRNAGYDHEQHQ